MSLEDWVLTFSHDDELMFLYDTQVLFSKSERCKLAIMQAQEMTLEEAKVFLGIATA